MSDVFSMKFIYELYPQVSHLYLMIGLMVIAFLPTYFILKKITSPIFSKIVTSRGSIYVDMFKKHALHRYFFHLFLSLYLIFWVRMFEQAHLLTPFALHIKNVVLSTYAIIFITAIIIAVINVFVDVYETKAISSRLPVRLHAHILKIIITTSAVLITLSYALDLNLSSLFASLGAAAALLTFVFKDTVLGLLASLQLTAQDIINIGDWITVPSYGADGDVESITITVVKVRNFDKTVSTIPTYALIGSGIKNWQGMTNSGGRRIKRAVNITSDSIKFCSQADLDKYTNLPLCSAIAKENPELFKVENRITNLTIFRHYIDSYLAHNDNIHQEGFTRMVRNLEPTPTGVPLQVYAFTTTTEWKKFESIQSNLFDHIFGILPSFDLKAFEYSGSEPITIGGSDH